MNGVAPKVATRGGYPSHIPREYSHNVKIAICSTSQALTGHWLLVVKLPPLDLMTT